MKIYSTREAAKELNTTVISIRHAINRGKLKATKFGKAYMITKKDLDKYAEYRREMGLNEE